ncbi:LysR substrate-binding domain-containing protein, partial [Streptomyces sp. NPDC059802]|uniref:LysR substrate-binding domain-containing protein n=1 Tax=Streptomyces sp. NPDC059802 TaxID=3346952 RepID=UPI00364780E5
VTARRLAAVAPPGRAARGWSSWSRARPLPHPPGRPGGPDVGLLYAPFDDLDGLAHETLHTEDRVVIVPAGHRLAGHTSVRMSDLEGETLPRWKGIPGGDGTGPEIADVVQMLQMIAVGRMIGVLPRSLVEPVPAGLVCVPVADAPPSRLVLAWIEQDRRPLVASFVAAALGPRRDKARSDIDEPDAPLATDNERLVPEDVR